MLLMALHKQSIGERRNLAPKVTHGALFDAQVDPTRHGIDPGHRRERTPAVHPLRCTA
jgi:hypothetical protein